MITLGAALIGIGSTLATRTIIEARRRHEPTAMTVAAPVVTGSSTTARPRVPGEHSRHDALGLVEGTPEAVRALMLRQVIATTLAGLVIALLVASQPTVIGVVAGLSAVAGAWQFPLIAARRRETERRAAVDRELTDAIGEMVMGVEAGLTLDAVTTRYADRHLTPLGDEFRHHAQTIAAGTSRPDALHLLRDRTPTPIMRSFISAVEQNVVLGTPLADVLRNQAETTRRHRRQAAEARAAGVSMKMTFPRCSASCRC